jgi:protein gp37
MAETAIEWTDATRNPVAGCSVVSPGCTNCYAMRIAARLDVMGLQKYRALTRKSGRRAVWTGKCRPDCACDPGTMAQAAAHHHQLDVRSVS